MYNVDSEWRSVLRLGKESSSNPVVVNWEPSELKMMDEVFHIYHLVRAGDDKTNKQKLLSVEY